MNDIDFDLIPGLPVTLESGVDVVLAQNPSPMTGPGTNTYLVGDDTLAVIDPGPLDGAHLDALLKAIGSRVVSHILVTHSHLDHSPLSLPLSRETGAPVYAFGGSFAGRSEAMTKLAATGALSGGEGLDINFEPDRLVCDGDMIVGDGWTLEVIHTPGHLGNHIALRLNDAIFVGDLVMGWSTSLVSPPDGDMTDFLMSCRRVRDMAARVLYSGHGSPIHDPKAQLSTLIAHREERAEQIISALSLGAATVPSIVDTIYKGLDPRLVPAAGRNVLAHLIDLKSKNMVVADGWTVDEAVFSLNKE